MALSPLNPWLARRMGLAELTPEGVARWQAAELRRTLAWARRASPFHARRLAGFDTESLRDPADLARLPRMEGGDLAAPGLLTLSQDEVERVVSLPTSGTTSGGGPPKRLSFSAGDLERTLDFFAVGMSIFTRSGDVALVLLPGRREWGVADLLARALPRIGAAALAAPEGWTPADVPGLLREGGAKVLVAAPGQLAAQLAALLELPAGSLRGLLRAVLSSAEPLDGNLRRAVEKSWGCAVFDHWGMTETGYGGGVECAAHAGYHVRMADLLLEIADAASGEPLPVGETGEIVVTTLGPRAMPLIRYRTGDAARLLPGPCPCGCPLPRLGPVPGRLGVDGTITRPEKGRGAS